MTVYENIACPFCKQFRFNTLPGGLKRYMDHLKVRHMDTQGCILSQELEVRGVCLFVVIFLF